MLRNSDLAWGWCGLNVAFYKRPAGDSNAITFAQCPASGCFPQMQGLTVCPRYPEPEAVFIFHIHISEAPTALGSWPSNLAVSQNL